MDADRASKLEALTGYTRDEMLQLVEEFQGAPESAPGDGAVQEVDPGVDTAIDPIRPLDDPLSGVIRSSGVGRVQGGPDSDGIGRNRQGGGAPPPPRLRSLLEAYQKRVSGSGGTREGTDKPADRSNGSGP